MVLGNRCHLLELSRSNTSKSCHFCKLKHATDPTDDAPSISAPQLIDLKNTNNHTDCHPSKTCLIKGPKQLIGAHNT